MEQVLLEVGFQKDDEPVGLGPQRIPSVTHRYSYDRNVLDRAIVSTHELLQQGRIEAQGITLVIMINPDLVNRRAIELHVELLRGGPSSKKPSGFKKEKSECGTVVKG